jgi:hypothetical protein
LSVFLGRLKQGSSLVSRATIACLLCQLGKVPQEKSLLFGVIGELVNVDEIDPVDGFFVKVADDLDWVC